MSPDSYLIQMVEKTSSLNARLTTLERRTACADPREGRPVIKLSSHPDAPGEPTEGKEEAEAPKVATAQSGS